MLLKNAKIANDNFDIVQADILLNGEKIEKIAPNGAIDAEKEIDLSGCTILPGFVDIHIHGCAGHDTGEATPEALEAMSAYLIQKGVTSFCPTTMTLAEDELNKILANVKNSMDNGVSGAYIQGVNMEGPYIAMSKKGAQNGAYVRKPDPDEFKRMYDKCGGIIKVVDIAPEEDEDHKFIKTVAPYCRVSIAHTASTFEDAQASFESGITHGTHLFNAMSGFTHRAPGVVGAIFDSNTVTAEIICDGFHINPSAVRIAFDVIGEDRMCIISDSCSAAGMADCTIDLGGQDVFVVDGKARLADGTIAASTSNIHEEFKNVIDFGIPFKTAMKAATINPAKVIGVDDVTGSIAEGKYADLVVLDKDLEIKMVIAKGEIKIAK